MRLTWTLALSLLLPIAACASSREELGLHPYRPPALPSAEAAAPEPPIQTIGGKGKGTETATQRALLETRSATILARPTTAIRPSRPRL
jgi:hypothetical protein